MKPFYMIFIEDAESPTHKHESLERAETEAKRLAKMTKQKAYILKTFKSVELNEFKMQEMWSGNDLPF